jgi:serine/threonine-protein kinase
MSVIDGGNGNQVGGYTILGDLGSGGMGHVYRAKDVKLGRLLALKVLQVRFQADSNAIARFQREAQVLASLSHPGIASIYGFEEYDGMPVLAMELVEGDTLAERMARGPMSVDEALRIAQLIAQGLDYAHSKGVVHRDLKPSNVKLTPENGVKLLDFGLATMLAEASDQDGSPSTKTQDGAVAGTLAYMAPEQVDGAHIDQRADIWAFGVIVFEMLAGRRPFKGDTVSETIACLLAKEPSWNRLPADTPVGVRNLLERCLHKDPTRRLRTISEAARAIRCCLTCRAGAWPLVAGPAPTRRRTVPLAAIWPTAALLTAAAAMMLAAWWRTREPALLPVVRFGSELDPLAIADAGPGPSPVLSPDGKRLVFCVRSEDGQQRLATRTLDQDRSIQLSGTENAHDPFFSPDGKWIAFFAAGKLKKISLAGGPPLIVCDAPDDRGGSWGPDGAIILAPTTRGGLVRVSSDGGTPQPVTHLDLGRREKTHRWPQVLPGGRAVVFTSHSTLGNFDAASLEAQSIVDGQRKTLLRGGYFGRYLPSGHLLYVHDGTVYALEMDARRMETRGTPAVVVEGIASNPDTGGAQFDVSQTGTLVYRAGGAALAAWSIQWMDRNGRFAPLLSMPRTLLAPRLSPDGKRVAMGVLGTTGYDIWVHDSQRGTMSRISFSSGFDGYPVWSPDGKRIAIESDRANGVSNLYLIRADGGSEPQRLTESRNAQTPGSFSPDGKRLAFSEQNPENGSQDIWTLPIENSDSGEPKPGRPELLSGTGANEMAPAFSPDGRWLAYESDESGSTEIYVRPFPRSGGKWQISAGGGATPIWSRARRELLFKTPDRRIMAASYTTDGDSFVPETPGPWSKTPLPESRLGADFDLAPDGNRIAVQVLERPAQSKPARANFVLNFFDELRRKLPVKK